jgi:hypothetical protein
MAKPKRAPRATQSRATRYGTIDGNSARCRTAGKAAPIAVRWLSACGRCSAPGCRAPEWYEGPGLKLGHRM